jgi:hypothetical protein
VIPFASHHSPIIVAALLLALATILTVVFSRRRSRRVPFEHLDGAIAFTTCKDQRSAEITDPVTFWRDEIRSIAEKHGSPVKAAIRIERSMKESDFKRLDDGQLEALHKYWREMSNWCGRVRIEMPKLDPERKWTPTAWTRLFNVFGRVNLLVQIAWSERFGPRLTHKSNGA